MLAGVSSCAQSGTGEERPLGELSDAEIDDLCATLEIELERADSRAAVCTLEGAINADNPVDCESQRDACLASEPRQTTFRCTLAQAARSGVPGCAEVAVGELLACWRRLFTPDAISCQDAPWTPSTPECLEHLGAQCPFMAD
jgi:hypothetical protein